MRKVLIIDDSPTAVAVVQRTLEREGYRVASISDLTGFYTKVREFDPDLVFLDLEMPDMSGIEVGKFIERFHKKTIPIIIYSSRPQKELERAGRALRAAAILDKSQGSIAISNTVRHVLARSAK